MTNLTLSNEPADTLSLCRVCALAKEGYLTNLYDASTFVRGQPNLHTMLRAVCASVFEKPDAPGMPTNVCAVCRNSIIAAYKLHKLCVESDRRLVEMLAVQEALQKPEEVVLEVKEEVVVEQAKLDDPFERSDEESSEDEIGSEKPEEPVKRPNEYKAKRTCKVCSGDFPTIRDMLIHMKKFHPNEKCGKIPKAKSRDTSKQKCKSKHRCMFCSDAFRTRAGLVAHNESAHPGLAFVCGSCKKIFLSEADLESHKVVHLDGKKYACDICQKRFLHSQGAKEHRTTHFGPYPCKICGKMARSLKILQAHMDRHSGIKRFACSLCSSRFVTKGELGLHMIVHTKQRKYVCDTCGSQFGKSSSLTSHVDRVHTTEKRYACPTCDLRFACSARLKRHSLTHTGEKPHKCPFCQRGFNQTNDLVKHAKNHVEGPFGCDRCDQSFRLMRDLRDHYGPAHVATGEQVDELLWTSQAALERLAVRMRREGREVK